MRGQDRRHDQARVACGCCHERRTRREMRPLAETEPWPCGCTTGPGESSQPSRDNRGLRHERRACGSRDSRSWVVLRSVDDRDVGHRHRESVDVLDPSAAPPPDQRMRLLAVSIGRFGGGSVRVDTSVISTARVLRLGRIRFRLADRRQPGRPAGHRLPLPALRPPTDRSTTTPGTRLGPHDWRS